MKIALINASPRGKISTSCRLLKEVKALLPENFDFEAHKELVPMQPGDVPITYADTDALEKDYGFKPCTPLRDGLRKFAQWYKEFYM